MQKVAHGRTQKINEAYRFLRRIISQGIAITEKHKYKKPWDRQRFWWQNYSTGFPDPDVAEIFIRSSHIISTGYNKSRQVLYIKFIGNEIFMYFEVPEYVFYDFVFAKSHGKYAMKYIYEKYRHRKCPVSL
jgi:hypothetical protein